MLYRYIGDVKRIFLILVLLLSSAAGIAASEVLPQDDSSHNYSREYVENEDIEINVKDGVVTITTSKTVTIKIFTILGQLITTETVKPGTKKFHIESRGIYILKAGSVTRRITI